MTNRFTLQIVLTISLQLLGWCDATGQAVGSEPSEGASFVGASWPETNHKIIRSLSELREVQAKQGLRAFEVELEAQLTFAAQYWNVFYIQDTVCPAMIRCTDAATSILCRQPVGQGLKIYGLVYEGQFEINLVSLQIMPDKPSIAPRPVSSIRGTTQAMHDTYVQVECVMHEMLDRKFNSTIVGMVGGDAVELHIEGRLSSDQLAALTKNPRCIASGTLSPKRLEDSSNNFSIRLMSNDQLTPVVDGSTNIPLTSQKQSSEFSEQFESKLEGQVLFSDNQSELLVGSSVGVVRVLTKFADILKPGFLVSIAGSYDTLSGFDQFDAYQTTISSEGELGEANSIELEDLLRSRKPPLRVTVEAHVADQRRSGMLQYYSMTSGRHRFTAIVNEANAVPALKFRTGDHVRLTGSPLIETANAFDESDSSSQFKLYVVRSDDIQFLSAPYHPSLSYVLWASSIGTLVVGLVFVWNWMLRQQVSHRTKRLNRISSHLRMSFEAISEAVLINDANRTVSGCNRQFARLFGQMPTEGQPVGTVLDIVSKRLVDSGMFTPLLHGLQQNTNAPISVTLHLEAPPQTVHTFLAAIVDSDGTNHGHLWTFSDVTEKLRLENELIQAQKMEAVGQLSGGIAHDFNNLLTVVRSNLVLLKHHGSSNDSSEFLDSAETAVSRAAELTQQLLDFSRRSRLDFRVVNLNDLVRTVSQLLQRSFDRTIQLETCLSAAPIYVKVDVNRLEQVLINIGINARDSMQGRAGTIILRVAHATGPEITGVAETIGLAEGSGLAECSRQTFATVEIEDNGSGMSRDIQQRIFEPFFTTKKQGEGTGLGLSMALGLIQQFGGTIQCESTPGSGTLFRIVLPQAEPTMTASPAPEPIPKLPSKPLRVLLVDDELLIRRSGQAILKALGHDSSVAANGREAIDLLANHSFDAVLLDLTMPVMGGKEAFIEIRSRWPHLPVAISTGYFIDTQSWLDHQSSHPPCILQKPYSVADLVQFLEDSHGRTELLRDGSVM